MNHAPRAGDLKQALQHKRRPRKILDTIGARRSLQQARVKDCVFEQESWVKAGLSVQIMPNPSILVLSRPGDEHTVAVQFQGVAA